MCCLMDPHEGHMPTKWPPCHRAEHSQQYSVQPVVHRGSHCHNL